METFKGVQGFCIINKPKVYSPTISLYDETELDIITNHCYQKMEEVPLCWTDRLIMLKAVETFLRVIQDSESQRVNVFVQFSSVY